MRFPKHLLSRALAPLAAVALWLCLSAASMASEAAMASSDEAAVWTPKKLDFTYRGVTTRYTCDGLEQRVKAILIKLGAENLHVRSFGCMRRYAPEMFPQVSIRMNVLQPAAHAGGDDIAAHWQAIDLLADRDVVNTAADCELIRQIHQQLLPLFAARSVDYSAVCQANQPLVGATRLRADVLMPDSRKSAETTAR